MNKLIPFIALLTFSPFLIGSVLTINPATDEKEIIFISAAKERNMGRRIDEKVREHFNLPVDPLVQKRIQEIGERIAAGADRDEIIYRFTVLDHEKDDFYNAFAAPGGYIYIFTDLIDALETDEKIAAVLAHEIAHVEAKHSIKRLQGNIGATILMILGSQVSKDGRSTEEANMAIAQLMAAYSRHDETQADELSVKDLKRAEFNPEGAVDSLKSLKKLRKKALRMKNTFYRSHPYLSERIADLKKYIKGYTDFDSYINLVTDKDEL